MSEMEVRTRYPLTPLVLSTRPQAFDESDAAQLAAWISKTALTASLLHPDETNPIPKKYFDEMYRNRAPLKDSVVWIAAYDVGTYPASSSMVPIEPVNGFRVTGNVGCLVYQVTAHDDLADHGLVLPPGELVPYLTQIWPFELRLGLNELVKKGWPNLGHLGRVSVAMNDAGLRYLSQVPDHSWGVDERGRWPRIAAWVRRVLRGASR
jgi:hypothetical protein